MHNTKTIKRIRIIGLIVISVGGLATLSNGGSFIILKLIDYPYELYTESKFYLSPLYLAFTGILLVIGGLLLRALKKKGLFITQLSSLLFTILTVLHSLNVMNSEQSDYLSFEFLSALIFMALFIGPFLWLIYYLNKSEIKNQFT